MNSAYLLGLVSDKVHTASVVFEPNGKAYTYLTTIPGLKVGQDVIVEVTAKAIVANGFTSQGIPELKVATVVKVDDGVEIEPESSVKYRWIISDLGSTARAKQAELHKLEEDVLAVLAQAEKKHRRKAIAEKLEAAFGPDALKQAQLIAASSGFVPVQEN